MNRPPILLPFRPRTERNAHSMSDLMSWLRGGFIPSSDLDYVDREIWKRRRDAKILPFRRRASA